jgi:hypothetical protein
MNKYFFLIILLFLSGLLKSQTSVYHPFPVSNASWGILESDDCSSSVAFESWRYEFDISGDTIVNGVTYHKLDVPLGYYQSDCSPVSNHFYVGNYSGCYREDTVQRKVYFIPALDSIEYLLYDFTLQIGDTVVGYLTNYCTMIPSIIIVQNIDSVLVDTDYRKRWNIGTCNIIEGIGSDLGLLRDHCGYYGSTLMCYKENHEVVFYKDSSFYPCDINVSTFEISSIATLIFPNPFNSITSITIGNQNFKNCQLIIYDLSGRMKDQQTIDFTNNKTATIKRNSLSNGMYFYQLISEDEKSFSGKFIIE